MQRARRSSTASIFRTVFILAGIGVLLWILSDIVLLVFAAVMLAVLLRSIAEALTRATHLPVYASLTAVTLGALLAVGGFGFYVGPRFLTEGQQLVGEITNYVGQLEQHYGNTAWGQMVQKTLEQGKSISAAPIAPRILSLTFGTAGGLLLLLATSLYLAVAPKLYLNGLISLVPLFYRKRAYEIIHEIGHVLQFWMLGQLIDMAVVGVLSTAGLLLLKVPLPFALGVIAGLLTFIPYLGAILAGIPAVIVASTMGIDTVIWVILVYFICHMVEGYIVAPVVSRRMIDLPPALTVLSMATLGTLYGLLGILIATPLLAAIIVLVREIYVRDVLGDDPDPA